MLRSAIVNGRDVLDAPLDITGGANFTGALLSFSTQRSELSGTLQTASTAPALDYFIVVFPSDASLWRPNARRIQSTRPASDGHFTFRDLPAGKYLMAAVTDVTPDDLSDATFLRQLVTSGFEVTLAEGEKKTQDLRIAK